MFIAFLRWTCRFCGFRNDGRALACAKCLAGKGA